MNKWIVTVTDEWVRQSELFERKVLEFKAKSDSAGYFNYAGITDAHRFLKGRIGEYAFESLLLLDHKKYVWEQKPEVGLPDKQDFLLFINGRPGKVDVKAHDKGERRWHFYINVKRLHKHYADIYIVGHFLEGQRRMRFGGWARHKELLEAKVKDGYVKLHPPHSMDDLWKWID
jgi:hypothetical protein